ncbi:MAG: uroporphyrinogen decarboxylase [Candidatus Fonsibacter ubiquis]|nr:uroporphyrinogen decarboxylase [Candidatus Fonsibacter ubiquis]
MSSSLQKSLIFKKKNLPIWFMRQAGRYLPEYQVIRKKNKNFINFCLNIKDATKVSLQPIERYNLDAAIVFSDILLILKAAGQNIKFKENIGPILENYKPEVFYNLSKRVYMINKSSPKGNRKLLVNLKKEEILKILKRLENLAYIHCKEQILAGADVIQLFDSWAGLIDKKNLKQFCINPNKNIVKKIKKEFPSKGVVCFPKGIKKNINAFIREVAPDGINLDYDINLNDLNLNNNVVFQGGLNPKFLLGSQQRMFKEAKRYLDFFKNRPYIFNLGHGILPQTKPENVKKLVEFVRGYNL